MKSIKEKAKEYGLQYPVSYYDADGNPYNDVDNPSIDFEEGANYVLNVIADLINQPMNDYLVLEELREVILQLKIRL